MIPAYLSPEWILLIGDDQSTDIAEASIKFSDAPTHPSDQEADVDQHGDLATVGQHGARVHGAAARAQRPRLTHLSGAIKV